MKYFQKLTFILVYFVTVASPKRCLAFSASQQPTFVQNIAALFSNPKLLQIQQGNKAEEIKTQQKRDTLKTQLLSLCKEEKIDRSQVETIIRELQLVQPVVEKTAWSSLLQKEWLLVWTTEKEINIFSDLNISGDITQTITSNSLKNWIPFRRGGGFGVTGTIEPDEDIPNRTNFVFNSATLDFGFLQLNIPPIGKGWFDTLYLDDDLRVDVNVRNDILICIPTNEQSVL